jgi:hypothetical protein
MASVIPSKSSFKRTTLAYYLFTSVPDLPSEMPIFACFIAGKLA